MDSEQVPNICSICHNEKVNPVSLKCGHIFCYLCIKSVAETTGACALCRTEIDIEFNFQQHHIIGATQMPSSSTGFYWFYEGYKGWWLYDHDTHKDLEIAYSNGNTSITKFIAGQLYRIDIKNMIQRPSDGTGRVRRILRSTLDLENILGMAGLRNDEFKEIFEIMKSTFS